MKKTATEKTVISAEHSVNENEVSLCKTPKPQQDMLQLTTKSIVKFWLFGLVFVFLGYLLFSTLEMIYAILTAVIIAISMEGIILSLEKKLKSRGRAIGIGYVVLMVFLLSGLVFVIPFLISQVSLLITWISSVVVKLKDFVLYSTRPEVINQLSWLPDFLKSYILEHWWELDLNQSGLQSALLSSLNTLLDSSVLYLKQFSSGVFIFIGSFFTMLTQVTIIFTLAVFFSLEKKYFIHLVAKGASDAKKTKVYEKIDRVYEKLSLWLKARLLLSLFVAASTWLALWILGLLGIEIPSIFSLSLITGLLDIVPYVWPLLAFIPLVVLALIHNGIRGMLIVGVIFLVIQWIQNNIITPILMEKQLGVNSLLILVAALLGAVIMGFWGIILSVPLAVIVGLFIDEE